MVKIFDIRVPLREDLKKALVFGIHARLPVALILSFYGYDHEVMQLMQTLSHSTRAFIWNADGLAGFVCLFKIMEILRESDINGLLEQAKKWQQIDLDQIEEEIDTLKSLETRMVYLSQYYPGIYIFLLRHLNQGAMKIERYSIQCESYQFEDDLALYSLFIHGHLIPQLQKLRDDGKLTYGKLNSISHKNLFSQDLTHDR